MPKPKEGVKNREELLEEIEALHREVAQLKSAKENSLTESGSLQDWPDALVEEMHQFVVLLDPKGHVLAANQTMLKGCGGDLKAIRGAPFWTLKCWEVSRKVNTQLRRAIRQTAAGNATRFETEVFGAKRGKQLITMDLTLKPLKDEEGRIVSLLVEGRDISERIKAQRAVERKTEECRVLYEELKEFDQLKTQFFANVSHELRTPLTLILGPVRKQLECPELSETNQRALRVIERNAGLLLQRVNNLLDLSKLEANEMAAHYSCVNLAKLGRLAASHFEALAEERELGFFVEMPEEMMAEVDAEKIQRVLLNLLSNAFKFTPNGGTITLTLQEKNQAAVFSVQDSGMGIVPDQRNAIFERFRQGETSRTCSVGGTGLGLSIVKEFVQLHQGAVCAGESSTGGAAFRVELPLKAPEGMQVLSRSPQEAPCQWGPQTVDELRSTQRPTKAAPMPRRANTPLILVVEDNPDMNAFLVETVSTEYRVITAYDGYEGFQKAMDLRPDLILTDMMMPHMSGEDLVRRIRKAPPLEDIPIVLLTAKADHQLHVKLLDEGAMAYLNKPFSAGELMARVRRLITERRKSQASLHKAYALLHSVTEGITDAVFVKDRRGRYLMINSAGATSVGRSQEAVLGKDDREFFAPETAQRIMEEDRQVMESGQARTYEQEAAVLGVTRHYLATRVPYRDEEGHIMGVMGISRDVTAEKKSERELREAKETAEAANKAKDRFLAILSHELRTPLTPVLATVNYMENCPNLPTEFRNEITMIRRNVEMEARLIDDLLDLTRISRGKIELHREALDAHASLRRALEICQGDIESKQISISQSLWAEEHHIWADPARMQQVFWNLINNAVKFTPKGGQISLRTWNESFVDDQGETVTRLNVEIADTGVGIASEVLPRIFSAFEQGERTVTREFGGLGLGLAISRALVRMHKATLTADSPGPGQGATFTFGCAAVESHLALESPTPLPLHKKSDTQQRILLVEDHEDTLRMMQQLLTMFGYTVQTASCVKDACDYAEQAAFDLVISDIGLPDGTGLDVMKHFRTRQDIKGIALSGFGMEEDLRRSREAGFARHLTKPINLQTLQQTIDEVLT